MRVNVVESPNAKQVYIIRSIRKGNKPSTEIYKKLGTMAKLCADMNMSEEEVLAWANAEALKLTEEYNTAHKEDRYVNLKLDRLRIIDSDKERLFDCAHLFLKSILYDLKVNKITRYIKDHHNFRYDINRILCDLVYARVLEPCSKRSSYNFAKTLLSKVDYELSDVYRALDILDEDCDYILKELYKNTNFLVTRSDKVLYYDCTNFYFEIDEEDELRKYGKSKEHRPNPIVTMGLFLDGDGLPLYFDIFSGNTNEQITLRPQEEKIIRDFDYSEFIYCSDSGLASKLNKKFNSVQGRHYVITQSIKKLKKEMRDLVFDTRYYKVLGSDRMIDLKDIDHENTEAIYYKEIPINNTETLIVTYSPKYAIYQRNVRDDQIKRAQKMIGEAGKLKKKRRNQNDPARFLTATSVTKDGEVASESFYAIDEDLIKEEAMYDGFYAVTTDLDNRVSDIIEINKGRWQIEECFRVMKSEFEGRPVYVRVPAHIKAHFLVCFIALLVFRLLDKKLDHKYTTEEVINTLRSMKLTLLSDAYYVPSYKRTAITDTLHDVFGFRTDHEVMTKSQIRSLNKKITNK